MSPRLLVVTNAGAGGADGLEAALAALRDAADVRVAPCEHPRELGGILEGRDGRRVVVAGGDGSLHNLVHALHQRGELSAEDPLGLLPLGTGNDLARTLGIPLDPAQAASVVLRGRPRALDLLLDDAGGVVVNVVHLGVGAEAAAAAGDLKPRFGAAAYAVGAVRAGLRTDGWRVRVEVDGEILWDDDEPLLMAALGNGRSVGGGTQVAPGAHPGDGRIDVVVSGAVGLLDRLSYASDLRDGEHLERDDVRAARGRVVRVAGEAFPLAADGELQGPVAARTWRLAARAWALLAA